MWFDTARQLVRVVVSAGASYVALVLILRISGKRTLAKLNAFDLVVTVALGSTLASIALTADVSIAEGAIALATLVSLQFVVAWISVRSAGTRRALTSEPTVVLRDGELLHDELRRQRLSGDEVRQAVRSAGVGGLELVGVVALESDGTLSVITREQQGSGTAITGVHDPRAARRGER